MAGAGASQLRFAICIPQQISDSAFDARAFTDYLDRAEDLGFDSAWTLEQVFGGSPYLSPLEIMTYAAAHTGALRLGCAVFVSTLHSPVHLAKSIATLDQLSRGRIEVGMGFGGPRMFSAFGVDPGGAVARFTEGIRLMKACWTEAEITFAGRFWQLDRAALEPKPFQKPHPPLWFGGSSPAALRRAVRHGDGFFGAGSQTTAQFAEQVRIVRTRLTEASRDSSTFRIAKRVYIAVDDDADRARDRMAAALQRLYGEFGRSLLGVAVTGTSGDCVRGLRDVAEAGARLILVNPLDDEHAQMKRLAADVLPAVADS